MLGVIDSDFPVHASKDFRCASFQSVVPSSCKIAKEVRGDFVEMSALIATVEVIFW